MWENGLLVGGRKTLGKLPQTAVTMFASTSFLHGIRRTVVPSGALWKPMNQAMRTIFSTPDSTPESLTNSPVDLSGY
jgi:hypothetical protein